jgi:hypothetical protein
LRVIRTFILRLLVNSAEPQALRGDLRPLPEGEALLALLRRLTGETAEPSAKGTDETSSEHRFPAGGEP